MDAPSKAVSIQILQNVFEMLPIKTLRWRYPSVLVVYQTIPAIVLALLVLVGLCARRDLFCSSRDLFETFLKPTSFCLVTGKPKLLLQFAARYCGIKFFRGSTLLCSNTAAILVAVACCSCILGCKVATSFKMF